MNILIDRIVSLMPYEYECEAGKSTKTMVCKNYSDFTLPLLKHLYRVSERNQNINSSQKGGVIKI